MNLTSEPANRCYESAAPPFAQRAWPSRAMTRPPRWLSTDLRDGNQALARPMTPAQKLAMFELLIDIGYTEIEVGFPVASQDEHDFVRLLIDQDLIPDGVWISVLVPARDELIRRTVDSLVGAPRALIHLYHATSPQFRSEVLGVTKDECLDLAVNGTRLMLKYASRTLGDVDLRFQYSPELFTETELDFSLEICEAVMQVWQPGPGRPIILNFPATVERTTPNVFADQIEWLDRHLPHRAHVCLSVHPHNDRGTGVAAAELAMLAGAERVEGCLFGNGERAGNVCLVTLGLNLLTQGIDPGIDFSELDRVRRTVEQCNQLPVHPRHPYAGDLVYTAFSGSHQDAINKALTARDPVRPPAVAAGHGDATAAWPPPYLPLDPAIVGRTYESVVRITSQSGKGGLAYTLRCQYGLELPTEMRQEFAQLIQAEAEADGGELTPERILTLFTREYTIASLTTDPTISLVSNWPAAVPTTLYLGVAQGSATDPVAPLRASLAPLGIQVQAVHHVVTTPASRHQDSRRWVFARCWHLGSSWWGAGWGTEVTRAAAAAVQAAIARAALRQPQDAGDNNLPTRVGER